MTPAVNALAADVLSQSLPDRPIPDVLPVLPVRDAVPFPQERIFLAVGRPKSLAALDIAAKEGGQHVLLVAQRDGSVDDPNPEDLLPMGCVARLVDQIDKGMVRGVFVLGLARAIPVELVGKEPALLTRIEVVKEELDCQPPLDADSRAQLVRLAVMVRQTAYGESQRQARQSVSLLAGPGRAADLILGNLDLPVDVQQRWLEELDVARRVRFVLRPADFGYGDVKIVMGLQPSPSWARRTWSRLVEWFQQE